MRILLDHNTPAPLRYWLTGHEVETAYEFQKSKSLVVRRDLGCRTGIVPGNRDPVSLNSPPYRIRALPDEVALH